MSFTSSACKLTAFAVMATVSATALSHGEAEDGEIDYSEVEQHPFGKASNPTGAVHTIEVEMSDRMRFSPEEVVVSRGETIRFVVKNNGDMLHEMVLGTRESLEEHAELMKRFPGMEHDEPHMAHVESGHVEEMGWQFTQTGEFFYGCLVPGHFEAGMKGRIIVQ